ncbi:cytochrome P450 94A1-like [Punica granatum]|uniref:Cytochrome P450 94A1-like n=1 Tax=Punica granatum TaxID=22663 RepID=A0A6P8DYY3_PUNGR|nr:cytochrome P450 94A1-like [Punica granatum]
MELTASLFLFLFLLPLLFLVLVFLNVSPSPSSDKLPKIYPLKGSSFALLANLKRRIQWTSDLIQLSPTATYVLHRPLGLRHVFTGNPATVQHILKTNFSSYQKGDVFRSTFRDILGDGIFNVDGDSWKFQRQQVSSHEFNTKSLRKFVETVVDMVLNDRLIPLLSEAARKGTILDMQDILQRFTFDNICKIAFGYDPACLSPSLPEEKFAEAFEEAANLSSQRFYFPFPIIWRIKRKFDIGSEKRLRIIVSEIREFARKIVKDKKREQLNGNSSLESVDLLSRFLSSGHSDEEFVIDIVISFILAGRDTTSAALTWYFWLLSRTPRVENEVIREIKAKSEAPVYEDVKDMVYTHASLCESMRFYPPVPVDTKEAICDDILPDGTAIKKRHKSRISPIRDGQVGEDMGTRLGGV